MNHAIRARHALLTSLGLLPFACATSTGAGSDEELGAGSRRVALAECGASAPLTAEGLETRLLYGDPRQLRSVDPGLLLCESGVIHRAEPVTCESGLPRPMASGADAGAAGVTQFELLYGFAASDTDGVACSADADCTAEPFGYCAPVYRGVAPALLVAACIYGCVVDADCAAGSVCECGDPVGRCIAADCASDDECDGRLCTAWFDVNGCGEPQQHRFACQTADDECAIAADCPRGGSCVVNEDEVRRCKPQPSLICGRPFLVHDSPRMATLVGAGGWAGGDVQAVALGDPDERRRVADHWARAGLMEHASIAAFARFALQLLHLGAPRELLEGSQRAMREEMDHARLCFALAERYLGAPVEAGALPMDGALLELDFERIVALCFREGCVGETVAALEARVARDRAVDPDVAHALGRIAPDEERHATLAWKFIRWALSEKPALTRALLARELRALEDELSLVAPSSTDPGAPGYGVLGENERVDIRRLALRDIVLPSAHAVLEAAPSSLETALRDAIGA